MENKKQLDELLHKIQIHGCIPTEDIDAVKELFKEKEERQKKVCKDCQFENQIESSYCGNCKNTLD